MLVRAYLGEGREAPHYKGRGETQSFSGFEPGALVESAMQFK
jgi:hypothetical protein